MLSTQFVALYKPRKPHLNLNLILPATEELQVDERCEDMSNLFKGEMSIIVFVLLCPKF